MKQKIIGLFVCMLVLLTSLPIVGAADHENHLKMIKNERTGITFIIGKIRNPYSNGVGIAFSVNFVLYITIGIGFPFPGFRSYGGGSIPQGYAGFVTERFICVVFAGQPEFGGEP
ncbi:MAG: hypothetical protein NT038_10885 [Euryarchaeota archaeon]|nr:hypothetical protein [Euryarchaeota archaeon]